MIRLSGRSLLEYAVQFYEPVYEWAKEYCKNPKDKTRLELSFEYLNSDSMKCMYSFLRILGDELNGKTQLEAVWEYEEGDDDMRKTGESFQSVVNITFNFVEVEEI